MLNINTFIELINNNFKSLSKDFNSILNGKLMKSKQKSPSQWIPLHVPLKVFHSINNQQK